jgi:hypothetical protein
LIFLRLTTDKFVGIGSYLEEGNDILKPKKMDIVVLSASWDRKYLLAPREALEPVVRGRTEREGELRWA